MFDILLAFSLHTHDGYNFVHPHVRYTGDKYIAGAFYNSERRTSLYIGKRIVYRRAWLEYGAVTGYKYPVIPMLRAGVSINDRANLFIAPAYNGSHGGLIGVEFQLF
jgi:hypothetical protein